MSAQADCLFTVYRSTRVRPWCEAVLWWNVDEGGAEDPRTLHAGDPARGLLRSENKHPTDVASPLPPPRICMDNNPDGKSCSDRDYSAVLNDPSARFWRGRSGRSTSGSGNGLGGLAAVALAAAAGAWAAEVAAGATGAAAATAAGEEAGGAVGARGEMVVTLAIRTTTLPKARAIANVDTNYYQTQPNVNSIKVLAVALAETRVDTHENLRHPCRSACAAAPLCAIFETCDPRPSPPFITSATLYFTNVHRDQRRSHGEH